MDMNYPCQSVRANHTPPESLTGCTIPDKLLIVVYLFYKKGVNSICHLLMLKRTQVTMADQRLSGSHPAPHLRLMQPGVVLTRLIVDKK